MWPLVLLPGNFQVSCLNDWVATVTAQDQYLLTGSPRSPLGPDGPGLPCRRPGCQLRQTIGERFRSTHGVLLVFGEFSQKREGRRGLCGGDPCKDGVGTGWMCWD